MSNTYLNLTLITVPVGTTRPPQGCRKESTGASSRRKQKKGQGLYFLVIEMQADWFQPSREQYFHSTIKGTGLCILITQKLAIELSWSIGSHCTVVCNHDFLDTNITTAVIAFHYHP